MMLCLIGADDTLAHQQLDVTVVAGARQHPSATDVIGAAVADVREISGATLHQAQRDGGARPVLQRNFGAVAHDLLVSRAQAQVQKAQRIEQRLRRGTKPLRDQLLGDLRGALALGVPAHAVTGNQQRRGISNLGPDPVLIALACALQAELSMFDAQAGTISLG